jgi:PEGA domain
MDLRTFKWGALTALVLACGLLSASASAETTLWLVRPLYPGQEALVGRTEGALDKLMPGEARKDAVIGMRELAQSLKGRRVEDVPCFSGDARCTDPIDPFVAQLGFDRVVLIQGGQDEAGFKYRVVSYEPKDGKVVPATSSNANLEKALLGAVAKVVPAASTLMVKSTPPGATVFVDDVKVGVTPLSTQVLPGERVVRLDLKLHQPIEEAIIIPIRGSASLEKTLEKVAARIVITASPAGTDIFIDGQLIAKDKVDRGILPGNHTLRLTAEKHKAFEQQISVKADEQYVLDKTLEPIPGQDGVAMGHVADTPNSVRLIPPGPPTPATPEQLTYDRHSYFQGGFEFSTLLGDGLVGRRWGNSGTGRTERLTTPGRSLLGATLEYGTFGKYFGLAVVGLSYLTNGDPWAMSVNYGVGQSPELVMGMPGPLALDSVRVHMVIIRAIQPQVRVALWRFTFALQLGLEFRTGQIIGNDPGATTQFYRDGFMLLDLLAAARLNVRFTIVDGLYLMAQGNYTQYLIGEGTDSGARSPSSWGFNVGVGYGF